MSSQIALIVGTGPGISSAFAKALEQPAGAWSWEIELRSYKEPF